jgi:drug/metabolite transporter (DMT)-like permease
MVIRASRVQATTGRARYVAPAFTAFMGVMFVGYGYFKEGLSGFLLPLGVGFLFYSTVVLSPTAVPMVVKVETRRSR